MKVKYTYVVSMMKGDQVEVIIEAEGDNARNAFFKKFLTDKDERYFIDNKTGITYNKEYIYSYNLKGESNV